MTRTQPVQGSCRPRSNNQQARKSGELSNGIQYLTTLTAQELIGDGDIGGPPKVIRQELLTALREAGRSDVQIYYAGPSVKQGSGPTASGPYITRDNDRWVVGVYESGVWARREYFDTEDKAGQWICDIFARPMPEPTRVPPEEWEESLRIGRQQVADYEQIIADQVEQAEDSLWLRWQEGAEHEQSRTERAGEDSGRRRIGRVSTGRTVKEFVSRYTNRRKQEDSLRYTNLDSHAPEPGWIYHPDGGKVPGTEIVYTPQLGEPWDRFGSPAGMYLWPVATPYQLRSLPPSNLNDGYHVYWWIKPWDAGAGTIKASKVDRWFEQPGGGIQYVTSRTVQELINDCYIAEVAN